MKKAVNNLFLIKKSLLVVLCVVCSTLSAWTADVASVTVNGITTNYTSFSSAWTAVINATAASTLKLLQDVSIASVTCQNNKQNCTIDLNGKTLSSSSGNYAVLVYKTGFTLTITDSSEDETGKVSIERTSNANAHGVYVNAGNFVLEKGTIDVQANSTGKAYSGVYAAQDGTSFVMKGGKIQVKNTGTQEGGALRNVGTMTIQGGTIEINVTNGIGYGVLRTSGTGTVTVEDGKFHVTGANGTSILKDEASSNPALVLQGGYYNEAVGGSLTDYCAANYYVFPNADATYPHKVAKRVASVSVGGNTEYYASFDDAWTAASGASSDATLTLLDDVSGLSSTSTYSAAHNLTVDLNGKTLSGTSTETCLFQVNCAGHTFTVTDGTADKDGAISFSTTSSSASYCVNVKNGTFVLDAGKLYATSNSGNIACVTVEGGAFTMNENGALHANYTGSGSGKNSRAVHANGTNGTTTINGGTIRVESTKDGIGIAYTAGTVTVNGGRFNVTATGTAATTNNKNTTSTIYIRGGYYNMGDDYLTTHVKTPCYVLSNSDATYKYRVAERYTVTFNNYNGTSLQSGLWDKGVTPAYSGATPTRPADAQYTYTFDGWDADIVPVTADATYTATYTETLLQAKASVAVGDAEPVGYATFDAAWSAATGAGAAATVKLLDDVSNVAMLTYTYNHNLTLDLNGHRLTSSASQVALQVNNAAITFTVTDSSIGKNGKIYINATSTTAAYGVLVSAGNFVLNGGTIEARLKANTSYGVRVTAGASFSMSDGMIDVVTTNSMNGDGVYVYKSGDNAGRATISGGTVSVNAAGIGYAVETVGTVTITGGCFYATGSSAACAVSNNGVLVLQGGYYNTNSYLNRYCATPYCVLPNSDATYPYKVAEGYTVTFKNYNNSSLQSGAWEKGATPEYTGAMMNTTPIRLQAGNRK